MDVISRRYKAVFLAACFLLALLLAGCSTPETPEPTAAPTEVTTEATTAPTEAETTEATENPQLATIAGEDLQGTWIAAADPVISEDVNYTRTTNAGYYEFYSNGNFIFTQILLVERGIWSQSGDGTVYKGTYELHGDILTLHYTEEAGESVDYTEDVNMIVDRSCADMCVRTPDHPKLGSLLFFRKARQGDPVNAITVLLSGGL